MAVRIEPVKKSNGEILTIANVAEATNHAKAVTVKVTKETDGPVTLIQKLQGYYKALIVLVGAILVIVNQATPIVNFLPANIQHYFNSIVVVLTAISVILVKNQTWINSL